MAEAAHEQNHRSIEAEILRLHAARTLLVGETNARKVGRPGTRMVRRKHIVVTRRKGGCRDELGHPVVDQSG
jgi:hypothetical protein